jgi:DNA modification methylase
MDQNTLYYGDNLDILRRYVEDESVDLIYLDPPFNSNADYNVLFAEKDGTQAHAQIKAFKDTWTWDTEAVREYAEVLSSGHGRIAKCLKGIHDFLGTSDMMAYLSMMAIRLIEMRRVLKPTGSIYLHCDDSGCHYLKLLMDASFGPECYRNEIIWQRTNAHNTAGKFGRVHDVILFYGKSKSPKWNRVYLKYGEQQLGRYKEDEDGRLYTGQDLTASRPNSNSGKFEWRGTMPPPSRGWGYTLEQLEEWYAQGRILLKKDGTPRMDGLKVYLDEMPGKPPIDVWTDIPRISNTAAERLGYPTQKPVALLERIIAASSNKGDIVLDPFCGCGTTIAAAQKLHRRWIGIDITHLAVNLIKVRLTDTFGRKIVESYKVVGEPRDLESARALATADKYQFQYWALGLVGARPMEEKKGADKGIDGRLYMTDAKAETRSIIISVKGGHVTASQVRDLRGVVEREDAAIGVFITLEEPTGPMKAEAAEAGFFQTKSVAGSRHPRLQILTIQDLLSGKKIDMPAAQDIRSFKQAPRAKKTMKLDVQLPFGSRTQEP